MVVDVAAQNPNCPIELLEPILEKGHDNWISRFASKNPNCPPEIKIKWMIKVGKITKFDPEKHEE